MKVIRLNIVDYEDRLIDSRESPFIPSSFLLSEDLSFEECLRGGFRKCKQAVWSKSTIQFVELFSKNN